MELRLSLSGLEIIVFKLLKSNNFLYDSIKNPIIHEILFSLEDPCNKIPMQSHIFRQAFLHFVKSTIKRRHWRRKTYSLRLFSLFQLIETLHQLLRVEIIPMWNCFWFNEDPASWKKYIWRSQVLYGKVKIFLENVLLMRNWDASLFLDSHFE